MANIKNIIGNKYGKLTVLELIDRNDKSNVSGIAEVRA